MSPALLVRQAALAGVALMAALGALALGRDDSVVTPTAQVVPATTSREASVGVYRGPYGRRTECGVTLGRDVQGVIHPVLPCGAKLVVSVGARQLRTEVVGRGPVGLRHEFDLTVALATRLGLERAGTVRWRFAG